MGELDSIKSTTKQQRERMVKDALNLASLGGSEPSDAAKAIAQEYIDGKAELAEVRERILRLYLK